MAYEVVTGGKDRAEQADPSVDVLLIGGGIISATLGVYLTDLEPDLTFEILEMLDDVAEESSNGWNNTATGHTALCELNYTPLDKNGDVLIARAIAINEPFHI